MSLVLRIGNAKLTRRAVDIVLRHVDTTEDDHWIIDPNGVLKSSVDCLPFALKVDEKKPIELKANGQRMKVIVTDQKDNSVNIHTENGEFALHVHKHGRLSLQPPHTCHHQKWYISGCGVLRASQERGYLHLDEMDYSVSVDTDYVTHWERDDDNFVKIQNRFLLVTSVEPCEFKLGYIVYRTIVGRAPTRQTLNVGDCVLDIYDNENPELYAWRNNTNIQVKPNQIWTIDNFFDFYDPEYRPPEWTKQIFRKYNYLAARAKIIVTKGSNLDIVRLLITEREPTNIDGQKFYDKIKLESSFGYRYSYYQHYWKEYLELAPNFGVYTETIARIKDIYYGVHIYNAIGYAFDSQSQPDYLFLVENNFREEDILNRYKQLIANIYYFAITHKFERIIMSLVGCVSFAKLYPGGKRAFQALWLRAFFDVYKNFNEKIITQFMGARSQKKTWDILQENNFEDIGLYPDCIQQVSDLRSTLFVNAWDPHSVPGNGNKGDNSLDGYIGRCTAIQLFGWGESNPSLLENVVICPIQAE